MKTLLLLKHWQLFMLIVSPPIILTILLHTEYSWIKKIAEVASFIIQFIWFMQIGSVFIKRHKLLFYLLFVSFSILYILVYPNIKNLDYTEVPDLKYLALSIMTVILLLLIISAYILSKNIQEIGMENNIYFGPKAAIVCLLIFFPFGIWYLQPKITELYNAINS